MTHLSKDALVAWRDRPTDDARAHVVPHLAACNACAALYAELVRAAPGEATPQRFDPAVFAARGRSARTPARSWARTWRWTLLPIAAAAVVLLAVFVVQRKPAVETPTTRGAAGLQGIAPIGAVDQAREFTWTAPAGADVFRFEISDASGRLLHEVRVTGRRSVVLPPDVAAQLRPGVDYRWTISRLDARGETLESSPMASFRIAR